MPAASVTDPAFKVRLMAPLATLAFGATVTSQVLPLPVLLTSVTVPLATVKLSLFKPITTVLNAYV